MGRYRKNVAGKSVTIEAEVDIDIDEYLAYATDEMLLEEIAKRKLDLTSDVQLNLEQKINLLTQGLSITQSYEIQEAIKSILKV